MPLPLAYREYGKGPPMVILHGLFGSAQNWHSMAERLAESYRVCACDLRNHGASPWADSMTFPEMADDLEALIDEKGFAPAIVLGHSVGGKTAMLVALKHPDLVERDGRSEWRLNLEAITANMDNLLGFPDVSALEYQGRALFVSGARSAYIGRKYHGQIYELFPQAEFAVIADSGHYPHVEQPEIFLKRITDFLESAYA